MQSNINLLKPEAPFFLRSGRIGCLLLHGFTGTPYALRELGERLYKQGITVLAPLLPGHGSKPKNLLRVSYNDWLQVCREQLEIIKNHCENVTIIGLSMGGTLGLYLAAEQRVSGVVSLSAPIHEADFKRPGYSMIRRVTYWPKWRSLIKPYQPELGYRWYPLRAVESFFDLLSATRERLPCVTCPLLIMHSKQDGRVPFSHSELIFRKTGSQKKELIALKTKHHALTLSEEKEQVFQRVAEFMEASRLPEHGLQTAPGSFNAGTS
jgi:carboxylesterase